MDEERPRKIDVLMLRWRDELVKTWRWAARIVAEAAKSLYPDARVYVAGGAAEGRLTPLSDVDVVVVLSRRPTPRERIEVKLAIMREAFRRGLPIDYPIDLHVIGPEDLERYRRLGKLAPLE